MFWGVANISPDSNSSQYHSSISLFIYNTAYYYFRFEGEDSTFKKRTNLQKEQNRAWLLQQMEEKKRILEEQQALEDKMIKKQMALDRRANELGELEDLCRKRLEETIAEFNMLAVRFINRMRTKGKWCPLSFSLLASHKWRDSTYFFVQNFIFRYFVIIGNANALFWVSLTPNSSLEVLPSTKSPTTVWLQLWTQSEFGYVPF